MDNEADPLLTFFTPSEAETDDILYVTLSVTRTASPDELRKAYRRAALRCHPDKHAGKSAAERESQSKEFQKIGFAWAVLSDEARRKRYDATGRTDEASFGVDEGGWNAYFSDLFERVDRKILDEDKKKYQGSEEERSDLIDAYEKTRGSFDKILNHIPHASIEDEARLLSFVEEEIVSGRLTRTKKWTETSTDKKAARKRRRDADAEAGEAEKAARELGVYDEFFGSGSKGRRNGDDDGGKKKGKSSKQDGEDALAALILRRTQKRAGVIEALEAKYSNIERKKPRAKGKGKDEPHPGELDDAAFEALQARMFGDKGKNDGPAKKRKTRA